MKRCPECGRKYPDEARFCARDATELVPERPRERDPLVGKELLGRYRVLELLGRGGFGTVYRVENLGLGRTEALKVLHFQALAQLRLSERERNQYARWLRSDFLRERRALVNLETARCPFIAGIYDGGVLPAALVGTPEDQPYFTMEFVEGEALRELVERQPRLALDRALRLLHQVCEALHVAHSLEVPPEDEREETRRGIVHRDLKLENVMLARLRGEECAKVVDFGVAKVVDAPKTERSEGFNILTPGCAAPEQMEGEATPAVDLFALGVLSYELLSGHEPWRGRSLRDGRRLTHEEARERIQHARKLEPVPLDRLRPDLPEALVDLVHQLLAKNPADRPASARVVDQALAEIERSAAAVNARLHVASEPVGARVRLWRVKKLAGEGRWKRATFVLPVPFPLPGQKLVGEGRTPWKSPALVAGRFWVEVGARGYRTQGWWGRLEPTQQQRLEVALQPRVTHRLGAVIGRTLRWLREKWRADPWLSMWTRPRATVRYLVDTNPTRLVLALAALAGVAQALYWALSWSLGDSVPTSVILLIAILFGPVFGIIMLYVGSIAIGWTGRWLGGNASREHLRTALAWAQVPNVAGLVLWAAALLVFGGELFIFTTLRPRIESSLLLTFLLLVYSIFSVWSIMLVLKAIGEVQGFSGWRAFSNLLLASLILGPIYYGIPGLVVVGGWIDTTVEVRLTRDTLPVGESSEIQILRSNSWTRDIDPRSLAWRSSNPEVASVAGARLIAQAPGSVLITGRLDDHSIEFPVLVTAVNPAGIWTGAGPGCEVVDTLEVTVLRHVGDAAKVCSAIYRFGPSILQPSRIEAIVELRAGLIDQRFGLALTGRGASRADFYAFAITGDGRFGVWHVSGSGGWRPLSNGLRLHEAVRQASLEPHPNHLLIETVGTQARFYANGRFLGGYETAYPLNGGTFQGWLDRRRLQVEYSNPAVTVFDAERDARSPFTGIWAFEEEHGACTGEAVLHMTLNVDAEIEGVLSFARHPCGSELESADFWHFRAVSAESGHLTFEAGGCRYRGVLSPDRLVMSGSVTCGEESGEFSAYRAAAAS